MYWLVLPEPGERVRAGLYHQRIPTLAGHDLYLTRPHVDGVIPEGCEEITRKVSGEAAALT